jgi:putative DNA primase/helicase
MPRPRNAALLPDTLTERDQWVNWAWQFDAARSVWTKVPKQPTGRNASSTDPETWSTFEDVLAAADRNPEFGVGYVFANGDAIVGIDLDDCLDVEGHLKPWAMPIIERFADTYLEVSPSGCGVKIFVRADIGKLINGSGVRKPYHDGAVEVYRHSRFFTVTGHVFNGAPLEVEEHQNNIEWLLKLIAARSAKPTAAVSEIPRLNDGDAAALQQVLEAARANDPKFAMLWNGDLCGFPSHSEADLSFCSFLAQNLGLDASRIDAAYRMSGRYRTKWDQQHFFDGHTYGEATIAKALEPPTGIAPMIDTAADVIDGLDARLQADVGAAFSPEIVGALAVVQRHDPAAWARAKLVLQKRHVSLRDMQTAITAARSVEPQPQAPERTAADVLPDCPAPWMRVPPGFSLDINGTYEWKARRDPSGIEIVSTVLVAHAPILIGARFRDVETGTEALRIHWRRPDGWRERTVDRAVALDTRRIIELAGEGFPVFSNNVAGMTKYLADAEALNWSAMPTALVSSHLGWQGRQGEHGFLAGRTLVAATGELIHTPRTLDAQGGTLPPGAVSFRGITAGDEQIVDAWHARGSMDEWRRAVSVLRDRPRVLAGLYGAFVPPLLTIMRCPNFIMDWAYRTSAGKTTTLRVAASVWGNPNEDEPDAALRSWDSTQVYIERAAAILSGLPLILDETKRVKDPRLVANIMYEVATGQGRGRGNVRSTANIRTWRTVLLSTGEAPAVSFTQDGGTRARCLEIRGAPFGSTSPQTAAMVNQLNMAVKGNYGHAGIAFVRWLLQHRNEWPRIEDEYRATVQHYCGQAPTGADPAVVSRLAQYAAALHQAAVYAHVALDLPWELEDPLDALWTDLVGEASDAAGEERALRDVLSWAYAHAQSFYGRHIKAVDRYGQELTPRMPPGGWSGRWDGEGEDWQFIAFFPTVLQTVLADLGYTPEAILAGWKERDWLLVDGDRRRYTTRQRVADGRAHVVAIKYEAIHAVESQP